MSQRDKRVQPKTSAERCDAKTNAGDRCQRQGQAFRRVRGQNAWLCTQHLDVAEDAFSSVSLASRRRKSLTEERPAGMTPERPGRIRPFGKKELQQRWAELMREAARYGWLRFCYAGTAVLSLDTPDEEAQGTTDGPGTADSEEALRGHLDT